MIPNYDDDITTIKPHAEMSNLVKESHLNFGHGKDSLLLEYVWNSKYIQTSAEM